MTNVVPIHYVPGDIFTWTKGVGVVEDSTLLANNYHYFTSHIVVKSNKTGAFKTFYLTNEITSQDEEIISWVYKSEDDVEVHILND